MALDEEFRDTEDDDAPVGRWSPEGKEWKVFTETGSIFALLLAQTNINLNQGLLQRVQHFYAA